MLPSDDPVSLDNNILPVNVTPKCPALSVQVVDVNKSKALHRTNESRSRYDKFIRIEWKYNHHVGRRDREPSRTPCKKLCRLLTKSINIRKQV